MVHLLSSLRFRLSMFQSLLNFTLTGLLMVFFFPDIVADIGKQIYKVLPSLESVQN